MAGHQDGIDSSRKTGYESISTNDLRAHLNFLASDDLEGRETSYRGQKVAAQYLAAMFGKIGLKPIGDGGTYFQRFPLTISKPSNKSTITLSAGHSSRTFSFKRDFLTVATVETTLTAPAVFIGYMNAQLSPEQESDLAGKVVVAFAGKKNAPKETQERRRRPYVRVFQNSAATIAITDDLVDGSLEEQAASLADQIQKGEMSLPYVPLERGVGRFLLFSVGPGMGAELLQQLNQSSTMLRQKVASTPEFSPVLLKDISLTFDVRVTTESASSENVVGLLEGSDPDLKDEYVVLTAHYDHLGISAGTGQIHNGADDDGSGTSMILELAEAFALNGKKPKRSLVFMTVAGEEKGLLGSRYYSDHPLVPLEKTAANINIDMIGRVDRNYAKKENQNYVYVIGSDKISMELDSLLHVANKNSVNLTLDYLYNDDRDPNQFYRRSDHYNFARKGVPIVFFFTGLHDDYHRPTDTVEKIEFDKMIRIGRLIYTTTWEVANLARILKRDRKSSIYLGS